MEQIWPNGYNLSASSETDYVFPCNQCVEVQDTAGITRGKNSPFVSYPNRISFENRKCIINNLIEDEIHFVLCPLYIALRKRYSPNYYVKINNMFNEI